MQEIFLYQGLSSGITWEVCNEYADVSGYIVPQARWGTAYSMHPLRFDGSRASQLAAALDDLLEIVPIGVKTQSHVQDILAWTHKYGLLRILLHRTISARFPDRKLNDADRARFARRVADASGREFSLDVPMPAAWSPVVHFQGIWLQDEIPLEQQPESNETVPFAIMRPRTAFESQFPNLMTIGSAWGPFFPMVSEEERETYPYPLPTLSRFGHLYSEPIDEWRHWTSMLVHAIECCATRRAEKWQQGAAILSWLTEPTTTLIHRTRKREVIVIWRSPSLLGCLAMEAMQRLAATNEPRRCKDPRCKRLFLRRDRRQEYHSDTCRWRHVKARSRAKTTPAKKHASQRRKA